ncbi:hypothetical protein [Novosphingobium sp.]|uniref:hypothetical protein n=1 Tax=Novosphingobium sp. TaxID=1874826 RepID=UPI002FDCD49C
MKRPLSHPVMGRLFRWACALVGAGLASAAPVQAQNPSSASVDPSSAPVEWVRYAQGATASVTKLLEGPADAAVRLRAWLDQARPAPDQPTAPLILKLWVAKDGIVSRVEFTPFALAEANADLKGLLVGQSLAGVPPKDILLPLRIAVQLDAPQAAPDQEVAPPAHNRT